MLMAEWFKGVTWNVESALITKYYTVKVLPSEPIVRLSLSEGPIANIGVCAVALSRMFQAILQISICHLKKRTVISAHTHTN